MKQTLYIGKEPNFQKIVITSAVIHILFIALVAIPIKTKQREYKSYLVNIVSPAELRHASPKKSSGVKTAARKKPAPKRRVKAKKKGVSLESAERVSKEIERLRALKAIAKKKKKKANKQEKEVEIADAEKSDKNVDEALEAIRNKLRSQVSKGLGIPSVASTAESNSYYAIITRKIWSEWIPPDYNATGIEVIISIKIDEHGNVVSQEIEKSSGNIMFDRSATKAITKASPLPPPPVELEVGVRFYL